METKHKSLSFREVVVTNLSRSSVSALSEAERLFLGCSAPFFDGIKKILVY